LRILLTLGIIEKLLMRKRKYC